MEFDLEVKISNCSQDCDTIEVIFSQPVFFFILSIYEALRFLHTFEFAISECVKHKEIEMQNLIFSARHGANFVCIHFEALTEKIIFNRSSAEKFAQALRIVIMKCASAIFAEGKQN